MASAISAQPNASRVRFKEVQRAINTAPAAIPAMKVISMMEYACVLEPSARAIVAIFKSSAEKYSSDRFGFCAGAVSETGLPSNMARLIAMATRPAMALRAAAAKTVISNPQCGIHQKSAAQQPKTAPRLL